jgi:ATP-dependent Clp protease ATP-binding subunit ClpX
VCLDEFDKLASGRNNGVFAGGGTTKDVTGLGVQRELLKLLESAEVTVPVETTQSYMAEHVVISTTDIAFVACGAFSGFGQMMRHRAGAGRVGFGRAVQGRQDDRIAVSFEQDQLDSVANFQAYGFLPELIGRFTRVVPFQALDHRTLKSILKDNVIKRMKQEFEDEGLDLEVEEPVLDSIVDESLKRETGARGLTANLTQKVEQVAFYCFGRPSGGRVRLRMGPDGVEVDEGSDEDRDA